MPVRRAVGGGEPKRGSRMYCNLMEQMRDLLEVS